MVVVDSNIIFSMLLKNNKFYNILKNENVKFIIPKFLFVEIFKYKEKIVKYSKLNDDEVLEILYDILKNITIVDEMLISNISYKKAYELVKDIDEKDIVFIALCLEFDAKLWSGDKKLINGLKQKNFNSFYKEVK
jgi:predicted nucleic acid-binding protein